MVPKQFARSLYHGRTVFRAHPSWLAFPRHIIALLATVIAAPIFDERILLLVVPLGLHLLYQRQRWTFVVDQRLLRVFERRWLVLPTDGDEIDLDNRPEIQIVQKPLEWILGCGTIHIKTSPTRFDWWGLRQPDAVREWIHEIKDGQTTNSPPATPQGPADYTSPSSPPRTDPLPPPDEPKPRPSPWSHHTASSPYSEPRQAPRRPRFSPGSPVEEGMTLEMARSIYGLTNGHFTRADIEALDALVMASGRGNAEYEANVFQARAVLIQHTRVS